jgi:pSer/pThr/pTyr-binding forkhead associated (FHA) protein
MAVYLEVASGMGMRTVLLTDRSSLTVGRSPANDLCVDWDETVSRAHAVFELVGALWCVQDLGSRSGTVINGRPVLGRQGLREGDEIRMGATRLRFRSDEAGLGGMATVRVKPVPRLTERERDVLVAMCRPVLASTDAVPQPASVAQIANEIFVSVARVKQLIASLYDKFELFDDQRSRTSLANEALRRSAVTQADLHDDAPG